MFKSLYPFLVIPKSLDVEQSFLRVVEKKTSRMAAGLSSSASGLICRFNKDDRGKPVKSRGVYWSVSHKKGAGAGVVSESPVGIDLEIIDDVWARMYDKTASDEEWYILGGRNKLNFYRNWTAKEAVLKIAGENIFRLNRFKISSVYGDKIILKRGSKYYTASHYIYENYICCIAGLTGRVVWNTREVKFPD